MLLRAPILAILASAAAFGQNYIISTLAGGGLPVNISGTSASLYGPQSVAVDTAGNIYFADEDNVLELSAKTGLVTVVAGSGAAGYSGDGGPATSAQLNQPHGVTVDSAGNLYIADTDNQCIRKVSNGVIATVAGNGTEGFSGDGGPATSAQLFLPQGVAVDSAGNLYISDTNNGRIRKVANGTITTFAGGGSSFGDNGPASSAQLIAPHGIALDSAGNLYIADTDNERIRKVSNGVITTVAGSGSAGFSGDGGTATGATLFFPQGVFVDSSGNIYIADTNNNRIRKVSNGTITTVAGNGTAGFSADNGPATSAEVNLPVGVAVDSSGNIYIADTSNYRIRKVAAGTITTVAGNGTAGFSGDNGLATGAELNQPQGVAVDNNGNVYVADTANNRVRIISGGIITTFAGTGTAGFSGDNGPATSAQLNQPRGLAVDLSNNVYIADSGNNRIREVSNGVITTIAGGGTSTDVSGTATTIQLNQPSGLIVDSLGNIFIGDTGNNRVRLVANGFLDTIAGTGTAGFSGDNPGTMPGGQVADGAELDQPQGVSVDTNDEVYVADTNNNRIRIIGGGLIDTIVGGGSSLGDGGAPASAQLFAPRGVLLDSAGDLFVADTGDQRIREVVNGIIDTIAGTGTAGFSGDNGPATSAQLNSPRAITLDNSGNIYIADTNNNRIRILTQGAPAPAITTNGIVPIYSTATTIQPGEWVSIYGTNLASAAVLYNGSLPYPTSLGGTTVTIDGQSAYLYYVSPTLIDLIAPADTKTGSVSVTVSSAGGGATANVTLSQFGPSFFLLDSTHVAGIILRANGTGAYGSGTYDILGPTGSSLGYATVAAKAGDVVELFANGLGPTSPAVLAGQGSSVAAPTTTPVKVVINNVSVTPSYAGASSEAGIYQINVTIPSGLGTGDVPLVATVGGTQSPSTVVISLQ